MPLPSSHTHTHTHRGIKRDGLDRPKQRALFLLCSCKYITDGGSIKTLLRLCAIVLLMSVSAKLKLCFKAKVLSGGRWNANWKQWSSVYCKISLYFENLNRTKALYRILWYVICKVNVQAKAYAYVHNSNNIYISWAVTFVSQCGHVLRTVWGSNELYMLCCSDVYLNKKLGCFYIHH